jgi:hypothetical protein
LEVPYNHDTFDRRIQLGASRRRREDAEVLHQANRWTGAIYMGGYAIECSLKALICYNESKNNFKDTKFFKSKEKQRGSLHDLSSLLQELPDLDRSIKFDRTGTYLKAWNTITHEWQKDALRYFDRQKNKETSESFLASVKKIHTLILRSQGEAS